MNTMSFIVWMLPIIFMLHDFEEIIMVEVWGKRYKKAINAAWPKKQPFGLNYVAGFQTPTLSIAVDIEFILFSLISLFSVVFQNYLLWYGAFLGVTIHLVFVHILLWIRFKHYVPGVITSIVLLFPSVGSLAKAQEILDYHANTILVACLLGIVLLIVLLSTLHKLMGPLSIGLRKYSETPKNE